MVNYDCQRCGYKTNHKSVFKKHLLRKNTCKPKLKEIPKHILLVSNGFDKEAIKVQMSYVCHTNVNPNVILQGLHVCKFCKKRFKSRQGKVNIKNYIV